jgi:hypothetical protein
MISPRDPRSARHYVYMRHPELMPEEMHAKLLKSKSSWSMSRRNVASSKAAARGRPQWVRCVPGAEKLTKESRCHRAPGTFRSAQA